MMSDLDVQIRTFVEAAAAPVTFEEIANRPTSGRRRSNGVRVLVGATVVLAMTVGAFVVTQIGGDRDGSANRPGRTANDGDFVVPSASMEPTLHLNERVAVDRRAYENRAPARGDIVVLRATDQRSTGAQTTTDVVKRVIGLPGETIEGRDGRVYIDGEEIDEKYLPTGVESKTFGPVVDPLDSYFVLGDNRQFSNDSTVFGPVASHEIVGRIASPVRDEG